jgi:hypothetical protein
MCRQKSQHTLPLKHIARTLFIVPGFFLLLSWIGCSPRKDHKVNPAFYYWKTQYRLSPADHQLLADINAKRLYLRLFDVDWDMGRKEATPVGILQQKDPADARYEYIPVVFITQDCLTRLKAQDLPALASKMSSLIEKLCKTYHIAPSELQIDCDWTERSAQLYFSLLKQLKQQSFFNDKKMSCTIRMHQVKYRISSGIPPVDRGLMMVYNMGNLKKYGGHNSILDIEEAENYLKNMAQYPLPMDIALPLYHWSVLFDQEKFRGIVYNIGKNDFEKGILEKRKGNLYRFKKATVAGGYSFREGEEIRFEQATRSDLKKMAGYLSEQANDSVYSVAFFHLDSIALKPFTTADLREILDEFH